MRREQEQKKGRPPKKNPWSQGSHRRQRTRRRFGSKAMDVEMKNAFKQAGLTESAFRQRAALRRSTDSRRRVG
jgi:hypothetical protein